MGRSRFNCFTNRGGFEAEDFLHCLFNRFVTHDGSAERIDAHRNRVRITDCIGETGSPRSWPGRRRQCSWRRIGPCRRRLRSTLEGSLPLNAPAAVTAHAAVAIHDDFAASQAGVPLRTAHDEATSGVDEELGFLVQQVSGQNSADDFLRDEILDLLVLHVIGVLRGNDDIGDAHRLIVFILDGHLALGIGTQPAKPGRICEMRVNSRPSWWAYMIGGGHQLRGFRAGVTEHQALIARPLLRRVLALCSLGIDPLGDVRALRGDGVHDEHLVRVKKHRPRGCNRYREWPGARWH